MAPWTAADVADAVPIQKENARPDQIQAGIFYFFHFLPIRPDHAAKLSNLVKLALNQAADFVHSSESMGNTQKVIDKGNTLVL